MTKELKALNRIKKDEFYVLSHYEYDNDFGGYQPVYEKTEGLSRTECFKIVRQGLRRLEAIDTAIEICKKANEQKYVYIKESYGIIKEKFLDDLDYEILNNRLYVNSRGMYYDFPLKDYGVWWALTKEELVNG